VDLALAAAILASRRNFSLGNTIFIGELSLTGVIKPVVAQERRVEEARRLGFTKIIEAKKPQAKAGKQKSESSKESTQTISVSTVSELVQALGRIASDVATHPQKEENE
jgi:predicted ATP-dependent serine protease